MLYLQKALTLYTMPNWLSQNKTFKVVNEWTHLKFFLFIWLCHVEKL